MIFEFAKATEVTELAHQVNSEYKASGITRVFLTPDVNDVHLHRVVEGYNIDYDREDGVFLLEWDKIPNDYKGQKLSLDKAKQILKEDSFDNWDVMEFYSEEDIIEEIDGGFGINNLQEDLV